jgi:hypothetical protein
VAIGIEAQGLGLPVYGHTKLKRSDLACQQNKAHANGAAHHFSGQRQLQAAMRRSMG